MSNKHILDKDPENKTVNCIFHIPVPVGNNSAGVPWKTAIVSFLKPVGLIIVNTDENVLISTGDILEVSKTVRFSSIDINDAQRLSEVNAEYDKVAPSLLSDLQEKLKFYGLGGVD